ncbi:hypothetical protein [Haemophilus parainfluenzae]|nr:hypothetical protein [Haemophilus parainfluenzae]
MCEEIIVYVFKMRQFMASSGNAIHLAFHNCLDDSTETTFNKVRNAKLSRWKHSLNEKQEDWVFFDKWEIRLTILDGRVRSSNVLTKGQIEEGSKEEVISILKNYLSDLNENNIDSFSFEIADTDPLDVIAY